jgi:hypothetical protein
MGVVVVTFLLHNWGGSCDSWGKCLDHFPGVVGVGSDKSFGRALFVVRWDWGSSIVYGSKFDDLQSVVNCA